MQSLVEMHAFYCGTCNNQKDNSIQTAVRNLGFSIFFAIILAIKATVPFSANANRAMKICRDSLGFNIIPCEFVKAICRNCAVCTARLVYFTEKG